MTRISVATRDDLDNVMEKIRAIVEVGECMVSVTKKATPLNETMHKSLHCYLNNLSSKLTTKGISVKHICDRVSPGFNIPVSPGFMKDFFRATCMAVYGKESTTDLTEDELKRLATKFSARVKEMTGVGSAIQLAPHTVSALRCEK